MVSKTKIGSVPIVAGWFFLQSLIVFANYHSLGLFSVIIGTVSVVIGVGLLKLDKWARFGAMLLFSIFIIGLLSRLAFLSVSNPLSLGFSLIPLLFVVIFCGLFIFYFTRPYIKEQFK